LPASPGPGPVPELSRRRHGSRVPSSLQLLGDDHDHRDDHCGGRGRRRHHDAWWRLPSHWHLKPRPPRTAGGEQWPAPASLPVRTTGAFTRRDSGSENRDVTVAPAPGSRSHVTVLARAAAAAAAGLLSKIMIPGPALTAKPARGWAQTRRSVPVIYHST
jgi:hypothetical protein